MRGGIWAASVPAGAPACLSTAAHLPLCSLTAAFIEDFYRPWLAPRKSEAHYLRLSKAAVWFFAAALAALALLWNASAGSRPDTKTAEHSTFA